MPLTLLGSSSSCMSLKIDTMCLSSGLQNSADSRITEVRSPPRCIIEKLILPEICLVLPGHDDGLGDNLRVLFSLGFMGQGLCLFVQVCIFIYKVQKVEAVAFCGVPYARHEKEMAAAISDDKTGDGFIYQMFLYELNNHEYGYTGDSEETLDALDYTMEQVQADARLLHGFEKARKKILGRG